MKVPLFTPVLTIRHKGQMNANTSTVLTCGQLQSTSHCSANLVCLSSPLFPLSCPLTQHSFIADPVISWSISNSSRGFSSSSSSSSFFLPRSLAQLYEADDLTGRRASWRPVLEEDKSRHGATEGSLAKMKDAQVFIRMLFLCPCLHRTRFYSSRCHDR